MLKDGILPTKTLQMSFKPEQAHCNDRDIDKTEICQDWNKVEVELLVSLEKLDINSERGRLAVSIVKRRIW